ncbi:hypothetical protein H4R18_001082 [Coemansia javaensis]|uniref:Uncharacterized protein n=1 Tax=Coemansia javaensis TaxID=2761396 RepID=A0A9W8HGL2_9FUNG|nr:hypothetical protein H4R18_001082 [Coemansia javaensis]
MVAWLGLLARGAWPAIALIAAAHLATLGYVLVQILVTPYPSVLTAGRNETLCRPAWQEPFEYKARVYISPHKVVPENATEFFESAQLLWDVKPASIGDKYPVYREKKATFMVPREFLWKYDSSLVLHAHMFVQRADYFSPHPDTTDPLLMHTVVHAAAQGQLMGTGVPAGTQPDAPERVLGFSVNTVDKLSWVLSLEGHTYRQSRLPSFVGKSSNGSCVYAPLLDVNVYTAAAPEIRYLAIRTQKVPLRRVAGKTHSMELELRGIPDALVHAKIVLHTYARVLETDPPGGIASLGRWLGSAAFGHVAYLQHLGGKNLLWRQTPHTIFATAICLELCLLAALVWAALAVPFWLGPSARRVGVSRASVLAELAYAAHNAVIAYPWMRDAVCIWSMMRYSGMVLAAIAGVPAAIRRRRSRHAEPAASTGHGREQAIAAARAAVDRQALWWAGSVFLLTAGIKAAASPYGLLSLKSAAGLLEHCVSTFFTMHFVPQAVLNHRMRSGTLVPPATLLSYSCVRVFYKAARHLQGDHIQVYDVADEARHHFATVVFVVQWIWYRRAKKQG